MGFFSSRHAGGAARGSGLRKARSSGMALVITLSLLVLVTIAIMAFFTRATANRAVETSRANQVVARQIASTAADYALGTLLSEISQNATISGPTNQPWYQVTNAAGALPRRAVASAVSGGDFTNLVRQSVAAADTNASSHNSAAASQNGRLIPAARWNEPRLNFGTGFTTTNQLPNWIYLNRDGSVTNAPSTNAVGRFAYNLYDVSGLLDANIAGNPNLAGSDLMEIKSTQAGADLTALGINQTAINQLAAFRSPQATNGTAFKNAVLAWQSGGFLEPAVNVGGASIRKMSFANRGDLIRYATRENTGLISALPSLTHFSISSNTPGVAVDADDNNVPDAVPPRRTSAATITRYRDDGTPFQVSKLPGDTLLDRRFSLAKLAWLTQTGPAPGISNEAIQACFGLAWNPTERRWDYVGHEGDDVRDEIATLEDVATQPRDPNFFELLYAGIGRDSMDLALGSIRTYDTIVNGSKSYSGVGGFLLDEASQQQAVQIAANILDQADGDNFPTRLRFNDYDFFGIEDLPYLSALFPKVYFKGTNDSLTFGSPPVSVYLIPQLWNPHQASQTPVETPEEIVVEFLGGDIEWSINTPRFNPTTGQQVNSGNPDPPVIGPVLTSVSYEDVSFLNSPGLFRSTPDILRPGPGVSGSLSAGVQPFSSTADFFPAIGVSLGRYSGPNWPVGFTVTSESAPPFTAPWRVVNGNRRAYGPRLGITSMSLFTVQLSYKKAGSNVLYPYATFIGQPGMGLTALNAAPPIANLGPSINIDLYTSSRKDVGTAALRKLDPRTSRFGGVITNRNEPQNIGQLGFFPSDNDDAFPATNYVISRVVSLSGPEGYSQEVPNMFTSGISGRYPLFRVWQNSGNGTGYADRDGIRRPADGHLAGAASAALNPMYRPDTLPDAPARLANEHTKPIILQRPFRSVAELGYVFRDQPWKTLDFFSAQSADSALLDLFCVSEAEGELTAGKLNPRSAPAGVLESVFRQTPYDEVFAQNPSIAGGRVSNADAATIAGNFKANSSNLTDSTGLPSLVSANHLALSGTLAKPSREAAVRTLMGMADFKTWRIFGDIIVQAGRFAGDTSPDRFIVESEERLWLSTAIDRNTGKILFRDSEFPVP